MFPCDRAQQYRHAIAPTENWREHEKIFLRSEFFDAIMFYFNEDDEDYDAEWVADLIEYFNVNVFGTEPRSMHDPDNELRPTSTCDVVREQRRQRREQEALRQQAVIVASEAAAVGKGTTSDIARIMNSRNADTHRPRMLGLAPAALNLTLMSINPAALALASINPVRRVALALMSSTLSVAHAHELPSVLPRHARVIVLVPNIVVLVRPIVNVLMHTTVSMARRDPVRKDNHPTGRASRPLDMKNMPVRQADETHPVTIVSWMILRRRRASEAGRYMRMTRPSKRSKPKPKTKKPAASTRPDVA
ncbi:hypothetical protein D9613_007307 [Agrocybe pediades]|uniref:Uncharacterized protein n=1 Tax=Agrocybe pediades TaxID=84607 RepID=A0A8H4VIN5_9AGAR|nr:hypothetical protein D9613_007307 [Agrocybe pediades]